MKREKLIVLRGNSGSGKTSVARDLQEHYGRNTLLISQDMVRREMLKAKDGPETAALPLLMQLLEYGSNHHSVTILEGILYADWYRPLLELAGRLYGENVYAYYFDLSFEETLRRHQTKPNSGEFGEAEMRRWWRDRDYSDVLRETALGEGMSRSEVVERICWDVG
ncbi:MAG: kinase [Eubacteriales bacterium]|nr:kinase [Clostridiales bacterium]MDD6932271.1 kinase [Eubacteriales bacterium]MDY2602536.1 kinase [Eubacteriales bacterium]